MGPVIELWGVTKSFRDGRGERKVLGAVTMIVEPGELVAVMGSSGGGKSTLLGVAAGLLRPDEGRVVVGGHDLIGASTAELAALRRHTVGYIEQHRNLLTALTATDNVALPLELDGMRAGKARRLAADALAEVGLAGAGDAFPDQLSGGEQQRVSVARALIGNRQVLIADEPTGALDSVTGESIMALMRRTCDERGAAVLMATHDRRHAAWADRVLQLRDGQIVGQQTAPDLDAALRDPNGLRPGTEGSGAGGSGAEGVGVGEQRTGAHGAADVGEVTP